MKTRSLPNRWSALGWDNPLKSGRKINSAAFLVTETISHNIRERELNRCGRYFNTRPMVFSDRIVASSCFLSSPLRVSIWERLVYSLQQKSSGGWQ